MVGGDQASRQPTNHHQAAGTPRPASGRSALPPAAGLPRPAETSHPGEALVAAGKPGKTTIPLDDDFKEF